MVVRSTDTLTGLGVTKLSEYAQAGLPIIFMGGLASKFEGYNQSGSASANTIISGLTALGNVHVTTSDGQLAETLASLSITPRTALTANGTWYTHWREDNSSSTDYVYVFNDATALPLGQGFTSGNITFETTGVPYWYDAWTGQITPVLVYEKSATTITISLELAGDQTTIIAFKNAGTLPAAHLQSLPPSVLGLNLSSLSTLSILQGSSIEPTPCLLSNGTIITLPAVSASVFALANWSLTVESWTSPSDPYDLDIIATRTNLSTFTSIPSLVPWYSISASLTNVSGRGYYSTSFQWPPSDTPAVDGAFIDLGAIIHTARVAINGNAVAALDVTWAREDITPYLVDGPNSVEVVVSTPLGNALRPIWGSIETSGKIASATVPDPPRVADYGLVFPVQILPYIEVTVAI